ncbi:uncharacterized protein LOC130693450 [Daphnia carinata]|uniref:uncharacterized protein LOC130693450 n=1 Tax=Daphnia carinata TaxID=120202 RepID=UPI00257AC543|nr:uncharacterized protein LOC130693450 [Daphnia carinata]
MYSSTRKIADSNFKYLDAEISNQKAFTDQKNVGGGTVFHQTFSKHHLLRIRIKNLALKIMKSSSALSLLVFLILDRNILIETKRSHSGSTRASRQNNRIFHPKSIFFNRSLISVPTVTLSSSTTVTQTDTISTVCAKLVNVTGPCLRRRGAWVEEPIVLSFHGEFDDKFDLMYSSVLGVETTPAPETTMFDEPQTDDSTSTTIASSLQLDDHEYQRHSGLTFDFIRGVSRWLTSILTQFIATTVTETTTSIVQQVPTNTVIFQQTITVTREVIVINTVFVQRCTPSPFPFSLCYDKKFQPLFKV